MLKSSWKEGPTPEEMYEPMKHFSQGNMPEPEYGTSMLHHSDDDLYPSVEDMYEPMKHFQDD
jgi:hypothetical protein